jgi:hypothetical protein
MKSTTTRAAIAAALIGGLASTAIAFDHADSPDVLTDPSTDITGLYAWTSGGKLELALNVSPSATAQSKFSTDALYVIHVNRAASYGAAATESTIVCRFDAAQAITCWPGTSTAEITTGDASATAGLSSASGKFKVFAGLRADPEKANLAGLQDMLAVVYGAAGSLQFNAGGCPTLDAATTGVLVNLLQTDPDSVPSGGAAKDAFEGKNVLSIVMEVDLSLLTGSGDILGVWASTNAI